MIQRNTEYPQWARVKAAIVLKKRKQMRETSNRIYMFKVNLLVHSAGRRLDQRSRRMLAVVSLPS